MWGHSINKKFILEKLRKLNRLAAITITPIHRSTPTKGLEVMFDLMPLELLIEQTALGAKQRLNELVKYDWRGSNKTGTILGHIRHWENREEALNIRQTVNDSCREILKERKYKINSDSFKCTSNKYLNPSQINVYTDGSKTDRGTGSGFVIISGSKILAEDSVRLNDESTVFQAELEAIRRAAEYIGKNAEVKGYKYVKIFSDSMSSLQALSSLKMTSKTVLRTAKELNNMASKVRRADLCWIKAHVGHLGNEMADKLAKDGTTRVFFTELPKASQINKQFIKEKIYEVWQEGWRNEPTCRQTKLFHPLPDRNKSKRYLKLARSQLSILVQITTGHNALAYHVSKQDPKVDPKCSLCLEADETFYHFITDCPRLRQTRVDKGVQDFSSETWNTEHLLEFAKTPAIEMLLSRI